jgi:hypothetical protein
MGALPVNSTLADLLCRKPKPFARKGKSPGKRYAPCAARRAQGSDAAHLPASGAPGDVRPAEVVGEGFSAVLDERTGAQLGHRLLQFGVGVYEVR